MTWEQFTDVLPILTLVLGFPGSQALDRRRERHDRDRVVLQRAADVEGEALLELQALLIDLPHEWLDWLNRLVEHELEFGAGSFDPEAAFEQAVKIGRPWNRAMLLASRVMDDGLRTTVQPTIGLAYPFHFDDVSRTFAGTHRYDVYPWDEALASVADATQAIGARLRQSVIAR